MADLCPYPVTCEYDDFRRTGVHFCARVKCPYRIHARKILAGQSKELASLPKRTVKQETRLGELKRQYAETLGEKHDD